MDLDTLHTTLEPRLLLETAATGAEPDHVGTQVLRVAKLELGAVQDGGLELLLELSLVRYGRRPSQFLLVLRVEALM